MAKPVRAHHELSVQQSANILPNDTTTRIVCACGWEGVWMPPFLIDPEGDKTAVEDVLEPMMEVLASSSHPGPIKAPT